MNYLLSKEFTQLNETKGTVQNASPIRTIEMSATNEKNSGILIPPRGMIYFSDSVVYLRCVDGGAEARVVPFKAMRKGGGANEFDAPVNDIWNDDTTGDTSGDSSAFDPDWDSKLDEIFGF